MKVRCVHGYFFFEEQDYGEMSVFLSTTGFSLVPKDGYFTFPKLAIAPDFSLKGLAYVDTAAPKTFEGKPWDVMKENGLVYDFVLGMVRPITAVTSLLSISAAQQYFYSDWLISPGARANAGRQVTGYTGIFRADTTKFRYTEVSYDEDA